MTTIGRATWRACGRPSAACSRPSASPWRARPAERAARAGRRSGDAEVLVALQAEPAAMAVAQRQAGLEIALVERPGRPAVRAAGLDEDRHRAGERAGEEFLLIGDQHLPPVGFDHHLLGGDALGA